MADASRLLSCVALESRAPPGRMGRMSGEQPVQVRLSGAREFAVDGVRHLGALVVATVGTLVALSGGEGLVPTAASLLNWAGIIAALAVATLLGHVLVTRI